MWVSSVALRAVSSGKAVIAVFRCAAFADKSLDSGQRREVSKVDINYIWEMSLTSLTPVERVISAASCLYRFNSLSISSATCGNGSAAFFAQKKSLESRS